MKEIVATITEGNEVALPEEVRHALGVGASDRVAFRIGDGQVRLVPAELTLEEVFGSVEPLHRPEDFEELIRQAKEERAERLVRKLREG